jgi:hypothetical protein
MDLDTARRVVADYLRETSQRLGSTENYDWGLDQGDLDAIAAEHRLPTTLAPAVAVALAAAEHAAEQDAEQDATARAHTAQADAAHLADGHADDDAAGYLPDCELGSAAEGGRGDDDLADGAGWAR